MTKTEISHTRKCIVSSEVKLVTQLLRFVRVKDGTYHFDPKSKILGRGAYVSNSPEALAKVFQKKLLNRAYKTKIDHEVYKKLEEEVVQWTKTKSENRM